LRDSRYADGSDATKVELMAANAQGSVLMGFFWMLLISILLFWLPGIGGLIAGLVGGKAAGGVGPAILAALLPAVVLGVLLFFFGTALTGFIAIGFLASAGVMVIALAHIGFLLLGAIIGGLLA